jgi:protein-tyrosine phosphatase
MSNAMSVHVLFVCKGNICRSPMAEAVFRHLVTQAGLADRITCDSAGTGAWHVGEPPHSGTRRILDQYGIDHTGLVARQVCRDDFDRFHYIVVMDQENLRDLHKVKPAASSPRVFRLLERVQGAPMLDVPDPWYTGDFEQTYDLVTRGCQALLAEIVAGLET